MSDKILTRTVYRIMPARYLPEDMREAFNHDENNERFCVVRITQSEPFDSEKGIVIDREIEEVLGFDYGKPEDQTLLRDWNWVAGALNDAYQLGREHAWQEKGDS